MNLILGEVCKFKIFNIFIFIIVQKMLQAYQEKLLFQIGKHYMIMIIELQKKIKIHFHIDLLLLMIISKKDIINIILPFIEQKELNIQEFMEIIHLRNFSYMINQRFIVPIIKLVLEQQNQQLLLFLDLAVMCRQIDFNIIWII